MTQTYFSLKNKNYEETFHKPSWPEKIFQVFFCYIDVAEFLKRVTMSSYTLGDG